MRILLDDEPCDLAHDRVGDAIAAAAAVAREQGRMIVEVIVDGQKWTSEQLEAEDLVGGGADEVRLMSALPRELAATVFNDAYDALAQAEAFQMRAAELIQSGKTVDGLREFGEALTIWLSVQSAVEQASQLAGIDLATAEVGGETAEDVLAKVKSRLEVLKRQIQSQDLLGVADTLLYDLPSALEEWREMVSHLAAEVGGK